MNLTQDQALAKILEYINNGRGQARDWYVGIASDPRKRLFNDHNVRENGDYWIYRGCLDSNTARLVEQQLCSVGFDGGAGGGDAKCVYVYAYKKTNNTVQ